MAFFALFALAIGLTFTQASPLLRTIVRVLV
jgi:hypothetical protein